MPTSSRSTFVVVKRFRFIVTKHIKPLLEKKNNTSFSINTFPLSNCVIFSHHPKVFHVSRVHCHFFRTLIKLFLGWVFALIVNPQNSRSSSASTSTLLNRMIVVILFNMKKLISSRLVSSYIFLYRPTQYRNDSIFTHEPRSFCLVVVAAETLLNS